MYLYKTFSIIFSVILSGKMSFAILGFMNPMRTRMGYYSGMLLSGPANPQNNYGFGFNVFPETRVLDLGISDPQPRTYYVSPYSSPSSATKLAFANPASCRPNLLRSLNEPGFCVSTSELDNSCIDREVSSSSDCDASTFDGQWCCYVPPTMPRKPSPVFTFPSAPKISVAQPVAQPVAPPSVPPPAPVQPAPSPVVTAPAPQSPPVQPAPRPVIIPPVPQPVAPAPAPPVPAPRPPAPAPPPPAPAPPPPAPAPRPAENTDMLLNRPCRNVNECPDSGTTCINGRCVCWTSQGISAARTWSCTEDSTCRVLFPGHICKPSRVCQHMPPSTGYCMPIGASSRMLEDFDF